MSKFLQSLRSDLLSRRLLPLAALALLALAVAVGYALASGGSNAASPPHASATPGAGSEPAALAVVAASPNPNAAESETPGGLRYQNKGPTRNPFKALAEPKAAASKSSGSATGKSSGSASSGSSGGSGTGGASPGSGRGSVGAGGSKPAPTPPKPSKPAKKASFPYDVSVLFGKLPAVAGETVTLPPFQNLRLQQPLPSASDARIALERVNASAKSAVFALLEPAILRGAGVCLPSASECRQLALETGRSEELEYIEEDGQTLIYELKTVSIVKSSAQAAG